MTYNVRAGGCRIAIDYETRHPDRIHVKNCIGIADFRISENNEKAIIVNNIIVVHVRYFRSSG